MKEPSPEYELPEALTFEQQREIGVVRLEDVRRKHAKRVAARQQQAHVSERPHEPKPAACQADADGECSAHPNCPLAFAVCRPNPAA